jgi:amidase
LNAVWREHGTPLLPATSRGRLDGVSLAVKDLIAVGGFSIGAGNPTWLAEASVEAADAWAVRVLRAAGATIAGIAQSDELAFSLSGTNAHYGTPPNPAAPDRVPGGSSSGSASAVANGMADIGLGTDTAGSIRVPASACGLYGVRPTHGAVQPDGVLALAPSFDTVGWLARDPQLLRTVGSVLLPPSHARWPHRLLCPDSAAAPESRRLADALGCGVQVGWPPGLSSRDALTDLVAAFRTVQAAEAWQAHGAWITANPGALASDVEARFRAGTGIDLFTYSRARDRIAVRRALAVEVLAEGTWLVLPAAAGPGHPPEASPRAKDAWRQATLRHTVPASAFGLPSCVVPSNHALPVGVALVGPPGGDLALLDAAVRADVSRPGVADGGGPDVRSGGFESPPRGGHGYRFSL